MKFSSFLVQVRRRRRRWTRRTWPSSRRSTGPTTTSKIRKDRSVRFLHLIQESILPNFFLHKIKIFSVFYLLSLNVCSIRKYCLYFKMAELKSENRKMKKSKFGWIDSWIPVFSLPRCNYTVSSKPFSFT
jgi:hypothetical protein